jgi:hypothetical protein
MVYTISRFVQYNMYLGTSVLQYCTVCGRPLAVHGKIVYNPIKAAIFCVDLL